MAVRAFRRLGSAPTVYAITSLRAQDAGPALLAYWLRGHWGIENQLHWIRVETPRAAGPTCSQLAAAWRIDDVAAETGATLHRLDLEQALQDR